MRTLEAAALGAVSNASASVLRGKFECLGNHERKTNHNHHYHQPDPQFGISRNGKTWVAIWINNQPTTAYATATLYTLRRLNFAKRDPDSSKRRKMHPVDSRVKDIALMHEHVGLGNTRILARAPGGVALRCLGKSVRV